MLTTAAPPVPLSAEVGSFASVNALNVADFAPALAGQNFTLVVQEAPGATAALLQLPIGTENWKSTWLGVMVEFAFWVNEMVPVFERVIDWAALQLPGATIPNEAVDGVRTATPDPPVPVSGN